MNQDRKRIWLINQYAVPTSLPGITRHFELFNEIQNENQFDITFWISSFNYSLRRFLSQSEIKEINETNLRLNLKWLPAFPHKRNNWKRTLNMISFSVLFFLRAFFSKKPEIIVASSPQIIVAYCALIISKIFSIRFVLEIRDLWPESLVVMSGEKDGFIIKLLYKIEKKLYDNSEHIIVLTEYQRAYLINKGYDNKRITLIPNGVLLEGFSRLEKEELTVYKNKLGVPIDSFVAIYTGAHGTANSLDQLVEAGKYLGKDEFIVLIGDGPEKDRLIKLKDDNGISQVKFLDPVPKTEILKYTSTADCGIISLENNAVFLGARPNKLYDYMVLGLPIISTIGGEVQYILEENGVGRCVTPNQPLELAEELKRVKRLNLEDKSRIRNNGWNYVNSEGNRHISAAKIANILSNLV